MKRNTKIILGLNVAVIIFVAGMLIYQLFIAEEKDYKIIAKAGSLALVYFLAMTGIVKKRSPLDYIVYADQYSEVIGEAFKNDKAAHKKLMKGLTLYKRKKYDKALKILSEAKRDCLYSDDFTAVLFFKACCHKEKKELSEAKACFEEILEHNDANALVWEAYGEVLFDSEDYGGALMAYHKGVDLAPDSSSAQRAATWTPSSRAQVRHSPAFSVWPSPYMPEINTTACLFLHRVHSILCDLPRGLPCRPDLSL